MLTSTALLLAVAGSATAQLFNGLNYTTSGPLNVTASQIPINMRNIWCNSQETVCRDVCGLARINTCDTSNFAYQCVCANGPTPNISSYQQSLPFFICTYWRGNCVDAHPDDFTAQQGCLSVTCGEKNASEGPGAPGSGSASSSSLAPSASGSSPTPSGGSGSGSGSASSSSSTSQNMAAATHFAQSYGTHLLAGGMLAAFGLAL